MFEEIVNPEYIDKKQLATTKDISGGGMRFTTMAPIEVGSKILVVIRLANEKLDQMFYLVADVIAWDAVEKMPDLWIVRTKFEFKNIKDRDLIIRYVFEEDRMNRKRENS